MPIAIGRQKPRPRLRFAAAGQAPLITHRSFSEGGPRTVISRDTGPAGAGYMDTALMLRRVTFHLCKLAPRYPDITCRDLTLGPPYCRAVSGQLVTEL